MRMRTTLGVVTGALALTAFAVPSAQATAAESVQPTVSDVVINGGKPIVAGTGSVSFKVSLNASHPTGVKAVWLDLFRSLGSRFVVDDINGISWLDCTPVSATTSHCQGTMTGYVVGADHPEEDHSVNLLHSNGQAGTWPVRVDAVAGDDSRLWNEDFTAHKVLRASALTVNASPEPIRKGGTLTVTGRLTRADWEKESYVALANQYVKLQYKRSGGTSWATLKTIKSSSTGALKTTTTATYDGSYRFVYAGATTTSAVTSREDLVDVQ
ncbi:calcium-binding protein [Streptomyces pharetrae]|uniref:calcium-binding protein n=1 Tax=Streptomyces pharetrae TaxID=291370 RepID=UPI003666CBD1